MFENIVYDEKSKGLIWAGGVRKGERVGTKGKSGYRRFYRDGKLHLEHRLVWLLFFGDWPNKDIDHINGDPSDNRVGNLRLATKSQNQANRSATKGNTSGLKGAYYHKRDKCWVSKIQVEGRSIHLGTFRDAESAHSAYRDAAFEIFGEYANPGPDCLNTLPSLPKSVNLISINSVG